MKKTIALACFVLVGSTLFSGCNLNPPVTQWEYKVVRNGPGPNLDEPASDTKLAALGSEGWELVSYTNAAWVLKRPKK